MGGDTSLAAVNASDAELALGTWGNYYSQMDEALLL